MILKTQMGYPVRRSVAVTELGILPSIPRRDLDGAGNLKMIDPRMIPKNLPTLFHPRYMNLLVLASVLTPSRVLVFYPGMWFSVESSSRNSKTVIPSGLLPSSPCTKRNVRWILGWLYGKVGCDLRKIAGFEDVFVQCACMPIN